MAKNFGIRGETDNVDEVIKRASKNPDTVPSVLEHAAFGLACNSVSKGKKFLTKIQNEYPEQVTPRFLGGIAQGIAHGGNLQASYDFIRQIKQDYPKDPDKLDSVLLFTGAGLAISGQAKKATKFLDYVQKNHPDSLFTALVGVAAGLVQGGYHKKAYAFVETVRQTHPKAFPSVLYSLGFGFALKGKNKEVDKFLTMVREKHPDSLPQVLYGIAWGLAECKNKDNRKIDEFLAMVRKDYPPKVLNNVLVSLTRGSLQGGYIAAAQKFEQQRLELEKKPEPNPTSAMKTAISESKAASASDITKHSESQPDGRNSPKYSG